MVEWLTAWSRVIFVTNIVPRLKDVVWERQGADLLLMVDRREVLTIADGERHIEALLTLLADGTRTVEELAVAMASRFPELTPHDLFEASAGLTGSACWKMQPALELCRCGSGSVISVILYFSSLLRISVGSLWSSTTLSSREISLASIYIGMPISAAPKSNGPLSGSANAALPACAGTIRCRSRKLRDIR